MSEQENSFLSFSETDHYTPTKGFIGWIGASFFAPIFLYINGMSAVYSTAMFIFFGIILALTVNFMNSVIYELKQIREELSE